MTLSRPLIPPFTISGEVSPVVKAIVVCLNHVAEACIMCCFITPTTSGAVICSTVSGEECGSPPIEPQLPSEALRIIGI